MPTVANYIAIQDSSSTMNDPDLQFPPNDGDWAHYFEDFDAPEANSALRPVLMLRVNPQGDEGDEVHLYIYLNDTIVVDQIFNTGIHRSWHEIVEADILKTADNEMRALAIGAEIVISDVVLLYRMDI
jgi:hypothetical protein